MAKMDHYAYFAGNPGNVSQTAKQLPGCAVSRQLQVLLLQGLGDWHRLDIGLVKIMRKTVSDILAQRRLLKRCGYKYCAIGRLYLLQPLATLVEHNIDSLLFSGFRPG